MASMQKEYKQHPKKKMEKKKNGDFKHFQPSNEIQKTHAPQQVHWPNKQWLENNFFQFQPRKPTWLKNLVIPLPQRH